MFQCQQKHHQRHQRHLSVPLFEVMVLLILEHDCVGSANLLSSRESKLYTFPVSPILGVMILLILEHDHVESANSLTVKL